MEQTAEMMNLLWNFILTVGAAGFGWWIINQANELKRLEEISDLLENEDTPLEDSIKLFEEGIELTEFCEEKLKSAKLKIDKIVKRNKSLISTSVIFSITSSKKPFINSPLACL